MTNQPLQGVRPNPKHRLMQDLEGWYILNEAGTDIYDYSGNERHCSINDTIQLIDGGLGLGRTFPAATDGILTGVPPLLEYTVSFWMMYTGWGGNQSAVGFGHPSDPFREIQIGAAIGGFTINSFEHTGFDMGIAANNPWTANTWHHFTLVRYGNNLTKGYTSFFNGEERATTTSGNFQISGSNNWTIGAAFNASWSRQIGGNNGLTNVRIYSRALGGDEIAELTVDPFAPFALRALPFPPTGLTAIRWGPVGRGRIRSAIDLGSNRIGGAP